jgi:A/G-specific adenine glycosylase
LADWFARVGRPLPWRATADPYSVAVSEFMLQQTQVATVLPYFERWMREFPDFETLAAAPEARVFEFWQGLGYYRRARNLHRLARAVEAEHGGRLPSDPEVLAELPGIGPYTAGAIASFAFDAAVPAIDGNLVRVISRIIDLREPADGAAGRAKIERAARAWLAAAGGGRTLNSALMDLGATVCVPRNPRCGVCPVRPGCRARDPGRLPILRPRPTPVRVEEVRAFIRRGTKFLLERQAGPVWTGLWALPPGEGGEPLLHFAHAIGNRRVAVTVVAARPPAPLPGGWAWFRSPLEAPMPAPHRRALARLLDAEKA